MAPRHKKCTASATQTRFRSWSTARWDRSVDRSSRSTSINARGAARCFRTSSASGISRGRSIDRSCRIGCGCRSLAGSGRKAGSVSRHPPQRRRVVPTSSPRSRHRCCWPSAPRSSFSFPQFGARASSWRPRSRRPAAPRQLLTSRRPRETSPKSSGLRKSTIRTGSPSWKRPPRTTRTPSTRRRLPRFRRACRSSIRRLRTAAPGSGASLRAWQRATACSTP